MTGDRVQVRVKGFSKMYFVHKHLLCSTSRYFSRYFNTKQFYKQGPPTSIELNDSVDVIEAFIGWLYEKRLDRPSTDYRSTANNFLRLYIFAAAKECHALQNDVIDILQDTIMAGQMDWTLQNIGNVFKHATSDPCWPIRKFGASCLLWGYFEDNRYTLNTIQSFLSDFPNGLKEYLILQKKHKDSGQRHYLCPMVRVYNRDKDAYCVFHIHDQGEQCRVRGR